MAALAAMATSNNSVNPHHYVTFAATRQWVTTPQGKQPITVQVPIPTTAGGTPIHIALPSEPLPVAILPTDFHSSVSAAVAQQPQQHHIVQVTAPQQQQQQTSQQTSQQQPSQEQSVRCSAPIASVSLKELRLKGSAFLRGHASKHGIPNASRKLTAQVLAELGQHYSAVHHIPLSQDDFVSHVTGSEGRTGAAIKAKRKSVVFKTEKPKPKSVAPPEQFWNGHPPSSCSAALLAHSRVQLAACGTSLLRPEAAAHKVHNASRKPKDVVVNELWQHYEFFHAKDLSAVATTAEAVRAAVANTQVVVATRTTTSQESGHPSGHQHGWVGNVIDEDEERK